MVSPSRGDFSGVHVERTSKTSRLSRCRDAALDAPRKPSREHRSTESEEGVGARSTESEEGVGARSTGSELGRSEPTASRRRGAPLEVQCARRGGAKFVERFEQVALEQMVTWVATWRMEHARMADGACSHGGWSMLAWRMGMLAWRMEHARMADGACSHGGWSMLAWRMEHARMADGACSHGGWRMLAWRMEHARMADGDAVAINQQGQRQHARSDVLCTHRARLVPALCLVPTSAVFQILQTGSLGLTHLLNAKPSIF
jgi:hypothetical protein